MKISKVYSPMTRILSLVLSLLIAFYSASITVSAEESANQSSDNSSVIENNTEPAEKVAMTDEQNDAVYEMVSLRQENVKHFRLADGSYVAAQYNYPVHYKDENGEFIDINNQLVSSGSEFATENSRVKFIKKITGNGNIFTLHENNTKIAMGLVGAEKKTEGVVTSGDNSDDYIEDALGKMTNLENISSTILYPDILDGVDIEYVIHSLNIKENIIVKERKDSYSYAFTLQLNNLSAVMTEDDNIYISAEDETVKYIIPAPIVYDAEGEYAPNEAAAYNLVSVGNGKYELTVTVDTNWMNDASRVFPITVDPAIDTVYNAMLDVHINKKYPDSSYDGLALFVSPSENAYIKFSGDYAANIPIGASVMKAELSLIANKLCIGTPKVAVYPVVTDWNSSLTWNKVISSNPEGSIGSDALDYAVISGTINTRYSFDITEAYREWLSGAPNYGLGLKLISGDATDRVSFASLNSVANTPENKPLLLVTYVYNDGLESYFPNAAHSAGVGGAGSINLATGRLTLAIPTLTATDNLFGFTPTLVYNSSLAGKPVTGEHIISPFSSTYLPYGFKLNLQEYITEKQYYDENGTSRNCYTLYDSDGTIHQFYYNDADSTYHDADGLGLTLTENTANVIVTDKGKNKKVYSSYGGAWYLTYIEDKDGNQLVFKFDSSYRPTDIVIKPVGMSEINMLTFIYNGAILCAVYNDTSKEAVILRYSSTPTGSVAASGEKYLRKIEYYYGDSYNCEQDVYERYCDSSSDIYEHVYASADYTYNLSGEITAISDNSIGKSIKYNITGGKITKISEFAGTLLGQEISYAYGKNYTDVRSTGNDEALGGSDDIVTRYVFDDYGRAVSIYSSSVDGSVIYGGTMGAYETSQFAKNSLKEEYVINTREEYYLLNSNGGYRLAEITGDINSTSETGVYTRTVFERSATATYNANMQYQVSGFGYSNSVLQNGNARFAIGVKVYYEQSDGSDDIVDTYIFDFMDVEDAWQFVSGKVDCKKDDGTIRYNLVRKIDLVLYYYGQLDANGDAPYALFERISFVDCSEFEAYRSYYDVNTGNLAIHKNYHYSEYYEYNEHNSVTRIANNRGEIYDYEYAEDGVTLTRELYYTFHRTGSFPGNLLYVYPYGTSDIESQIMKTLISQTSYTYNEQGLMLSAFSFVGYYVAEGGATNLSYTYDVTSGSKIFGAMLTSTDSLGHVTKYFYDNTNGNLLAEIELESGSGYVYAYDEIGRLEGVFPATGTATSYSAVTNAESVEYTYDGAHRLSKINTETTEYTFTYDSFGNSTSVSAGDNTLATYEYNPKKGKIRGIYYGNGLSEEYVYNDIEKVAEVWYNYSNGSRIKTYSYEYNTDGTLKKFTNHKNGEVIEYEYDYSGRFISSSESKTSDPNYKNEYSVEYDGQGRVIKAVNLIDYLVSTVSKDARISTTYIYNSNGTLDDERTTYLTGETVLTEYTYDGFNRLTESYRWTDDFEYRTGYTYYSEANYTTGLVSTYTSNVNGTTRTYNYTYDSKGNIINIDDSGSLEISYTYDDLGQLISETKGLVTRNYEYDAAGNITSISKTTRKLTPLPDPGFGPIQIYSVIGSETSTTETTVLEYSNTEWGDLLTSFDGVTITYDAIGNPLSYYNGTSYTFTWEGRRLVGAVSGSNTMSFEYNDEGIRTSKIVNGVETIYYVNGGQIIAEKTDTRTIIYIYDASGAPIGMMYRTTSYAENVWDVFWYEKNLQGDIIAVYSSAGAKLATYTYSDAWGNHLVSYTNGGDSTGVIYNPFRYRGYYYDSDLGMYYLQSRYYDAKICRFISADGYVSTGQGILGNNMFAYCGNNPVNMVDPTGEIAITTLILIIVGAAIITTAGAITYGALAEDTIVLDLSYTSTDHTKYGGSLLIDFKGGNIELYPHIGVSSSTGLSFSVGKVFNYEGPGSYGGPFLSGGGGFYIGGEYCFNPLDSSGPTAASITFSASKGIYGAADWYFEPISYNYKEGKFNQIERKDYRYEIPFFPIL